MKYLFIVQGEGRGHLTQAISLSQMLRRHGHEVVEVLVGKSSNREIPAYQPEFLLWERSQEGETDKKYIT